MTAAWTSQTILSFDPFPLSSSPGLWVAKHVLSPYPQAVLTL